MHILMITINDPAGTAIEFTKAINQYTDHSCRLITKEIRYNFMFEKDLHLPWLDNDELDEVEELLQTSDIFHFHMTADENIDLGPFRPVDYMRGKEIVQHHHGHPDFRANPEKYSRKYSEFGRRNILVSTPDLIKLMPEATWQPNLVPICEPLYQPVANNTEDPIRVCQAPTRKNLKNTDDFQNVFQRLRRHHPDIELVLIENTKHDSCLRIKQSCHIHFDHMQGYFGVSSLESMSQGKPVIAGIDAYNERWIKTFTGSNHLPWIVAKTADELEKCIQTLLVSADQRHATGIASRRFMETCWTEKQVVQPLIELYERL
jgi:hypothetical protein